MSKIAAILLAVTWIATAQDAQQNWTHRVRIGGNGLSLERVDEIVRQAEATNVFGIETDNDIPGRYESFLNPDAKLKAIRAMAEKAHAAGNRAFVYVAALECITANADKQQHSFFKDHPDWVQRNRKGEPAMFGGGVAFWVRKGDEDVWISPYAPEWRKRYMALIRQIAATGIDGIWIDIPYWMTHFEGWEDTWASFDDYTVAAFKARTGLDARNDFRLGDFKDPGFRRWVDFRISSITDFVKEIDRNIKAANPKCMTIPEIYPGFERPATVVGADVYQLYPVVDAIGHEYHGGGESMAASRTPLDWFGYMIGMYSFRAFAEGKATWMLSYSWDGEKQIQPSEAMKNLFLAEVMAGANAYDARGHVMSGSNDMATRKAVFGWIRDHEKTLYHPRSPIRPIGVYFSPTTRNYFAPEFVESFKGTMMLLMHSHREFQIVTPRTLERFKGDLLILPDARCLGDAELKALAALKAAGKKLVVTGDTGAYALDGEKRANNPLLRAGVTHIQECPGRAYFEQLKTQFDSAAAAGNAAGAGFEKARVDFDSNVIQHLGAKSEVEVTASPFVSAQIARVDGKPHVFFANFKGLKSKQNAQQAKETHVRVRFSAPGAKKVFLLPYLGQVSELPSKRDGAWLSAVIPEIDKGAVVWCE